MSAQSSSPVSWVTVGYVDTPSGRRLADIESLGPSLPFFPSLEDASSWSLRAGVVLSREGVRIVVGRPLGPFRFVCRSSGAVRFLADALVSVDATVLSMRPLLVASVACGILAPARAPFGAPDLVASLRDGALSPEDEAIVALLCRPRSTPFLASWTRALVPFSSSNVVSSFPVVRLSPRHISPGHAPSALPFPAKRFSTDQHVDRDSLGVWLSLFARWRAVSRAMYDHRLPHTVVQEGFPSPAPFGVVRWWFYLRSISGFSSGAYLYDPVDHALEPLSYVPPDLVDLCERVIPLSGFRYTPADALVIVSVRFDRLLFSDQQPLMPLASRTAGVALGAALAACHSSGIASRIVEPVPVVPWFSLSHTKPHEEMPLAAFLIGLPCSSSSTLSDVTTDPGN